MKEILEKIKPTAEEKNKVSKIVREVLKILNKVSKGKAILGGSGAKGTWLSGTKELDIFVKFNLKYKNKDISKILEKELKRKFRITRLHGSRDYFQLKHNDYIFEVIPVLNIKRVKDAANITDVSPFHALWVKKHKKYANDIRLIKQFAKAQGVYGAESYLAGFSGYVLEILVIYYKGFRNLVKNAAKWKEKVVIDVKKQLRNPLKELNKSKIVSPLIVVDPVDKTRNAAAGLSKESFSKFASSCKKFLKKPGRKYFEIKEEKVPEDAVVVKFKKKKGKEDIIGAKLVKKLRFLVRKLNEEGFRVVKYGWKWDRYWFKVGKNKLSKVKEVQGPPVRFEKHVKRFRKLHKKCYVRGKKLYSKVKRKYPDVRNFLIYWMKK